MRNWIPMPLLDALRDGNDIGGNKQSNGRYDGNNSFHDGIGSSMD